MKTRNGFVSNSSSSSFVCMGISLSTDTEAWVELYNKLGVTLPDYEDDDFEPYEDFEYNKEFVEACKKLGLDIQIDHECDTMYFGYSSGYLDDYESFEVSYDKMEEVKDKLVKLGYDPKKLVFGKFTICS
jgi:hypothetical protein